MRVILVGVWNRDIPKEEAKESLKEAKGLVEAVGWKSLGYILQRKERPDVKFFVGEGKAQQIGKVAQGVRADAVVIDSTLSPSQHRNLEETVGVPILDRTDVVLEIFSQRAKSKEAKLQVDLAKLNHQLSRLQGKGKSMSRLGGGVGTRGPGEQESEIRKRLIRKRIHQIEKDLEEVKRMRRQQRKRREKDHTRRGLLKVALVGYTNAGKSTLLRTLTHRDTFVADMLFATLDTKTSSRTSLSGTKILFTDTVGFIKNLPTELIESFKATLEEVSEADIILHVVDISDDRWIDHIHTVREILKDLEADEKEVIYVLNKADRIVDSPEEMAHLPHPAFVEGRSVVVSADKGWGIRDLLTQVERIGEEILSRRDTIPQEEPL